MSHIHYVHAGNIHQVFGGNIHNCKCWPCSECGAPMTASVTYTSSGVVDEDPKPLFEDCDCESIEEHVDCLEDEVDALDGLLESAEDEIEALTKVRDNLAANIVQLSAELAKARRSAPAEEEIESLRDLVRVTCREVDELRFERDDYKARAHSLWCKKGELDRREFDWRNKVADLLGRNDALSGLAIALFTIGIILGAVFALNT